MSNPTGSDMADRFEADLRAAIERMANDERRCPYQQTIPILEAAFKEVFELHLQKYGGVMVDLEHRPELLRCITLTGYLEVPEGEFPPWLDAGLEEEGWAP